VFFASLIAALLGALAEGIIGSLLAALRSTPDVLARAIS
jgi:hypothetical protein